MERITFRPDCAYTSAANNNGFIYGLMIIVSLLFVVCAITMKGGIMCMFPFIFAIFFGLANNLHNTLHHCYFDLVNGVLHLNGKRDSQNRFFYKDFDHLEIVSSFDSDNIFSVKLDLILKNNCYITISEHDQPSLVREDATKLARILALQLVDKSSRILNTEIIDVPDTNLAIKITFPEDTANDSSAPSDT